MAEPNTVETNNEPTLDQFNKTDTKPAASQPAATDATPAPATTDAKPAGQQPSGQAAAQQTQTQAPQDPYANFMDGIQIPQGVKADAQLYDGLKDIAKQFNMPIDAVKALVSLDLTNTAAERMAEDISTRRHFLLQDASPRARLVANVVFPHPPFGPATTRICAESRCTISLRLRGKPRIRESCRTLLRACPHRPDRRCGSVRRSARDTQTRTRARRRRLFP